MTTYCSIILFTFQSNWDTQSCKHLADTNSSILQVRSLYFWSFWVALILVLEYCPIFSRSWEDLSEIWQHMWYNQRKLICNVCNIQFSCFNVTNLPIYSNILIQTPSQSDIRLQRYNSLNYLNNVKYKNLSPLPACNSKSMCTPSNSFS